VNQIKKNIIFFFLPIIIFAQSERDSLSYSTSIYTKKILLNNFDKQLNTYNFNFRLKEFYQSEKFFIGLNENYNSTIIKISDKNIKDEQFLWLLGQYNLSDVMKIGFLFNNNIYADDRRVAINKTSSLNSTLFLKFTPEKQIQITTFGGLTNNNQIGEQDKGLLYGGEGGLDNYLLGDFEIYSIFKFQNEDISPRKNSLRYLNFDIKNINNDNFVNKISGFFVNQRKDFYFSADQSTIEEFGILNNIQSRLETNYLIEDRVEYVPRNSNFSFNANARIVWRDIEKNTRYTSVKNPSSSAFDSRINEFRLELTSAADYKSEHLNLSFKYSFAERDEKHQPRKIGGLSSIIFDERERNETQKNNNSRLSNISLYGNYRLSKNDKIIFSLFHRKLIYDTPSTLNSDDRDELLSIGRIQYERVFNPFFKAFVNLEGSQNKIVYIFAERSSNNNTKRIIKFASGGQFNSGKLTSSNTAEIMANYTVFDYEEFNPNFRSYSFRQFVFRDSTIYRINSRMKIFIAGYVKLSEQGDFNWAAFTSKPQRFLTEQYLEPKFYFEPKGISFAIGIRFFSLSTFNITDGVTKEKISEYKSIGPVSEIGFEMSDTLTLKTYGWYEFIKAENNSTRELVTFNLKLYYKF
jgi:hypothetical protein